MDQESKCQQRNNIEEGRERKRNSLGTTRERMREMKRGGKRRVAAKMENK